MRYWHNVYRADFVYTVVRFYTASAEGSHARLAGIAKAQHPGGRSGADDAVLLVLVSVAVADQENFGDCFHLVWR
jgi:hypothetical protein